MSEYAEINVVQYYGDDVKILMVETGAPGSKVKATVGTPSVFITCPALDGYISRADTFTLINALLDIIGVDGQFRNDDGTLVMAQPAGDLS